MIKFAVIREGKRPIDERVPLTPDQLAELKASDRDCSFVVQSSDVRRIKDEEYRQAGIDVVSDVSNADVLLGVKEVPSADLIPGKTYLFFSHTIKMQPYNKELLRTVLEKNVRLIDWECLRDRRGRRLIGFGRYAGIVGAYNGMRAYGLKKKRYTLRKARDCEDRLEMESELDKVKLDPIKILLTGRGKVAKGAMEILDKMGIRKVGIRDYISESFDEPVYCQITFQEYFKHSAGHAFYTKEFYDHPDRFESDFKRFSDVTDFFIAGHYWNSSAPFLFTRADARHTDFRISLIADISCDIDGPVASTIRPSTIEDPIYGYDPETEKEVSFDAPNAITVMAVDNLPCELPRDASRDFGKMFIQMVLPSFLSGDKHGILEKATIAENGMITEHYAYLKEWLMA